VRGPSLRLSFPIITDQTFNLLWKGVEKIGAHNFSGSAPAVAVSRLSKYFPLINLRGLLKGRRGQGVWALREVDFQVAPGEVLFILGPNGSGKTTLIKLLATLLAPTGGQILIYGRDASREPLAVKRHLGYITCNESSFYGRLTGWQNLSFFARLHGLDPKTAIPPVVEELDLTAYLDRRYFTYSTGIKRRMDLARGLLHRPDILLMDEPTTNLDPISAAKVRELMARLKAQGKTMIVVTHRLEEVQRLNGRVAIMKEGRFREILAEEGGKLEDIYARVVGEGKHVAS
jgi:ABC-2 type transport system ATP-binding protein